MKGILIAAILVFVMLMAIPNGSGQNSNPTLIALKGDDTLSPEMDPESDPTTKTVQAEYVDLFPFPGKALREWVDAGSWTVNIGSELAANGGVVNIWYQDVDDGSTNSPQWNASIYVGGSLAGHGQADGAADADTPTLVTISIDASSISVGSGQDLEVRLRYTGWEDATLYYDCLQYPAGWQANTNALQPVTMTATKSKVNLIFVDVFDITWRSNDWLYVYACPASDGSGPTNPEYRLTTFTVLQGEPVPLSNSSKAATILQFDAKLGDGEWKLGARMQYNNDSFLNDISFPVKFKKDDSGGPLGDLPGFEAPLIVFAILATLLVLRRRR